MRTLPHHLWIALAVLAMGPAILCAADTPAIAVGRFSAMSPGNPVSDGWEAMIFDKIDAHTAYRLVEKDGRTVVRADSTGSASGLVKAVIVDPREFPQLTWSWKVSTTPPQGDVTRKSGDDFAARIYVTFAEDPDRTSFVQRAKTAALKLLYGKTVPSTALVYVWGNRAAVGSHHPSPYTETVQMFVVESGSAHLNQWRSASRNIVDDYRVAFGADPPPISGIAIMTDTDNTGASATAWYGDITVGPSPQTGRPGAAD